MSNQQPKSAAKKKAAPKSKTSSTASKKEPEVDERTMSILDRMEALLDEKEEALKPLQDFHTAVESAEDEDVRVFWDVRIVSGKDTPLKAVQGTSTMPGLLTDKMLPNAPSMIQQEIVDKIALPLTGVFMREGEVHNPLLPAPEEDEFGMPDGPAFPDYAADEAGASSEKLAGIIAQSEGRNVQEAEVIEAEARVQADPDPDDEAGEEESSERKEEERDDV